MFTEKGFEELALKFVPTLEFGTWEHDRRTQEPNIDIYLKDVFYDNLTGEELAKFSDLLAETDKALDFDLPFAQIYTELDNTQTAGRVDPYIYIQFKDSANMTDDMVAETIARISGIADTMSAAYRQSFMASRRREADRLSAHRHRMLRR
ncbi:MAG: hypothetical protein LBL52_02320 [Rickettsiales bacterium]|jgi:hypothetical protein|nr:hypothetical protein [Rickettsiales bacterium]